VASVLSTRDFGAAALVAGGILVIEQVMGSFVDPLILGRRIAISPLVVLVSLGFWSILWGISGAILAVPLTVLVILAMAHFEALRPAALLLTDRSSFEELEEYRHSG
jgi:AI-2 transport protein TqsA